MKTSYTFALGCCFALTGLMISTSLHAQTSQTIFNSNGTFTVPAGVTVITVELWGGGGGAASENPAGGGGGGGYARKVYNVDPNDMITVSVGSGGLAGGAGMPSTIDGITFANGGATGSGTIGGAAGSYSGSPDAGSSGGNGADAAGSNGGGGGGAGGSFSSGTNGMGTSGGAGGGAVSPYGAGGDGGDGGAAGQSGASGLSPGGGGGGQGTGGSGSGAGANGLVIIHYCLPVEITSCPAPISVNVDAGQCTAVVNYTVEADNDTAMVFQFVGPVNNSGNGTGSGMMFPVGVTTVTVTALNDCSEEDCVFSVTVTDNEPPVIDCPNDVAVACDADLDPVDNMALGEATAMDNCPNVGTPSYMDAAPVAGICPVYRTIDRTWTVQDFAGNPAICTQVISLLDNQAPVVTFPNDVTIFVDADCLYNIDTSITGRPVGVSDCDPFPDTMVMDVTFLANQPDCSAGLPIVHRTWTIADDCNNTTTDLQVITVRDNMPPVLSNCPADITVTCYNIPPAAIGSVSATDNCTQINAIQLTVGDSPDMPDPPYSNECGLNRLFIRTWTATDDCGNSSTCTQEITVRDTSAPYLVGIIPSDQSGMNLCFNEIPVGPTEAEIAALYADSCGMVTVFKSGSPTGNDCAWSVTYTYVAEDDCGNQATPVTITYSGSDQDAPSGSGTSDITGVNACLPTQLEAQGAFDEMHAVMGYSDDCSASLTASLTDTEVTGNDCAWTVTYTYDVLDACGTPLTDQTYTRSGGNIDLPSGSPPAGTTGIDGCYIDANTPPVGTPAFDDVAAAAGYTDDCGESVTAALTSTDVVLVGCDWTVTYTFSVTDACDNTLTNQTIVHTGSNQSDPTGSPPAPILNVDGCMPTPPEAESSFDDTYAASGYMGACGEDVTATLDDAVVTGTDCGWTVTYTFTVTDECNNTLTNQQYTRSGSDQTDPFFVVLPADGGAECNSDENVPNVLAW